MNHGGTVGMKCAAKRFVKTQPWALGNHHARAA
jgi:hypothetical protein